MPDIPARELQDDVGAVLSRVAQPEPLPCRPTSIPWEQFRESLRGALADSGLTDQLAELIPDTTNDLPLP